MADLDALHALSYYFRDRALVRDVQPLGSAGGWSGSRLWRVTAANGRLWCLRRYPEGEWQPRLAFVHEVLTQVFAGGLTIVPVPLRSTTGATAIQRAGHWWELAPWMPGTADFHAHPSRQRLRAAMQTLARFHLLAQSDLLPRLPHNLAPAFIDRASTFRGIDDRAAKLAAHLHPGLGDELDDRAARLLDHFRRLAPGLAPRILSAAQQKHFLQPAIRDIWHDHVLFSGDEVSGIVDFGAMRLDTPLTDIARLVGSLVADDHDARQAALDAYSAVRPLSDDDRRLIDLLDESGLVVAAVNWLTWLYVERRDMGPILPVVGRLNNLLRRLEGRIG